MTRFSAVQTVRAGAGPCRKRRGVITFWPLVAATLFMVSGGTYGTEEIVGSVGFARGLAVLALTPILWSLPTALMIGELSAALPCEGGYYAWVRRTMGNFWGFQEAWLSLAASIFDMAIYPTLFVAYLTRLIPWFAVGHRGISVGLAVVACCALMNVAGIQVVADASVWLFLLVSAPFAVVVVLAPFKHDALAHLAATPNTPSIGILGGVLIAMWNYMGWDCASTVAAEVDRPQRTYPLAMLAAVAIVALSYILPFAAMWRTGIAPAAFETGAWADLAGLVAGAWLRVALALGGLLSAFGMFNALVLSYSRLPLAMAQDGMLPPVFARLHPRTLAPWVAIVVLALGWALCLGLDFEHLVTLDVLLYGGSLLLEFVALAILRVREPALPRPFRVPGGLVGTTLIGVAPMLLLGLSVVRGANERILGVNALVMGAAIIAAGFVVYSISSSILRRAPERMAAEEVVPD